MNFKKLLALLLALAMLLCCFAACDSSDKDDDDEDEKVEDEEKDEDEDEDEDEEDEDKDDEDKDDDKDIAVKDEDLEGTWVGDVDLAVALSMYAEDPFKGEAWFEFEWEITEDEIVITIVDVPSKEDILPLMREISFRDLSEEEIEDFIELRGYDSADEYVEATAESFLDSFCEGDEVVEAEYTLDGEDMLIDDGTTVTFEIEGDEMKIVSVDDDSNDNFTPFAGFVFKKQ